MGNDDRIELVGSRLFAGWLASTRTSLAFTTFQAGKLFLVGSNPDGRLSIFARSLARCMGLGTGPGGTIWMSSLYQLWRFENFLEPGTRKDGRDGVFVPVVGYTTGDLDIHDIGTDEAGRPIFVATRYNCLATTAERASFTPLWFPPFIDRLAAEDRCHLLWLVQSGTGEFGSVDLATGRFEPVCFLQGYGRGVAFVGDHAVIAVSNPREGRSFDDLKLGERLAK